MSNEINTELVKRLTHIWLSAKTDSPLEHKNAVCVSTIDLNGFPQSRFVDLKDINNIGFIFCTSYLSEKGRHLSLNPNVSLTAWWDHIGYQIRVVGKAEKISTELADKYWQKRNYEAQIATTCFEQSKLWDKPISVDEHFNHAVGSSSGPIARPDTWGGFVVVPDVIEILTFKTNRVHLTEQYSADSLWAAQQLQP